MKNYNKELIRRYRDNSATQEELEVFFHLMNEGSLEKDLREVMEEELIAEKSAVKVVSIYRRSWLRIAAAAVVILALTGSYFLLFNEKNDQQPIATEKQPQTNDVAPGGNKAVLTIADGSTIILDNAANGTLTQQGNTKISKLDDGQLAYNTAGETKEVLYNTITTPRGGQYQMILSDGSKVWLNAASSIRFPVAFSGIERNVEITGEAYFEVAKSASMPFKVNVAGKGEVEVLGTHFNINSYSDEASINTTLLEGSVKVISLATSNSQLIKPGEQAQIDQNDQISIYKNVDTEEIMAWKNGMFNFNSADIVTIMRQIGRWYDVDVAYEGKISKETYSGIVSRNSNVSQVLKIMEQGGVKFKIEGKKIIVIE